jgi:hypothetical protein
MVAILAHALERASEQATEQGTMRRMSCDRTLHNYVARPKTDRRVDACGSTPPDGGGHPSAKRISIKIACSHTGRSTY